MEKDIVEKMNLSDEVKSYWENQDERLDNLNEKFQKRLKSGNNTELMIDSIIEEKKYEMDDNLPAGRKFLLKAMDKVGDFLTDDKAVEMKEQINQINDNLENRDNISDLEVAHSSDFKDWKKENDQEYQEGMQKTQGNQLNIDFGRYLGYAGAAVSIAGVAAGALSVAGLAAGFSSVAVVSTIIHNKNTKKAERLDADFEENHDELLKNIAEPENQSNEQDLENELKSELDGNSPKPIQSNDDLSPDEMSMAAELKSEISEIQPKERIEQNKSKNKNRM